MLGWSLGSLSSSLIPVIVHPVLPGEGVSGGPSRAVGGVLSPHGLALALLQRFGARSTMATVSEVFVLWEGAWGAVLGAGALLRHRACGSPVTALWQGSSSSTGLCLTKKNETSPKCSVICQHFCLHICCAVKSSNSLFLFKKW